MIFSSLIFMFVYLPFVLGIYFLTPLRYRNFCLLIANLIFYGFGEPIYILIMIFSILVDYSHGILVEKYRSNDAQAKRYVLQSVFINLSMLFFFKYYDFFIIILKSISPYFDFLEPIGIPLPIGISFYTFQTMSYTIDIYRRDAKAQRNIIDFGVYVTLFPQLIAGPIVKYKDISSQLTKRRTTLKQVSSGIELFVYGLFKKVLLANNIGLLWDTYKGMPSTDLSIVGSWLGIIAFAFQIYFDFSGYSDMARGLGRMLGFEFLENFNYPYIAKSASDFWRRWHISLSSWFRDYVYIPLGGNQVSVICTYRNILIVWLATGLWHGASWNFIIWGLYYAIVLILEKAFLLKHLQRLPGFISHLYAIIIILIGWCIFAVEGSMNLLASYMLRLFGYHAPSLYNSDDLYYLTSYGVVLALCLLFAIPFHKHKELRRFHISPVFLSIIKNLGIAFVLLLSTAYLVDASYNPFLYFRF
ncbi:MAG: MBOAT family O-acyltransferase [Eubacteriales bacterium]